MRIIILIATCILLAACAQPLKQITDVASMAVLDNDTVLAYANKTLTLYRITDQGFILQAKTDVPGHMWAATRCWNDSICVAHGYSRGDLDAPIRILQYTPDLHSSKTLLTKPSARSETTFLRFDNNTLIANYFTEKYFTQTSRITQGNFSVIGSRRMASSLDIDADRMLIGRRYGDNQTSDGDAILIQGNDSTTLPTLRGVSAVAFFGDDLLIADGWHQYFGKSAEPRLSLIQHINGTYQSRLIDTLRPGYSINRIQPFTLGNTTYVLAVTDRAVAIYDPSWHRTLLYTAGENHLIDAQVAGEQIVLLDQNLTLLRLSPADS